MKNTVLRDHVYAIIKNAKEMVKVPDRPPEREQSPKSETKVKQVAQVNYCKVIFIFGLTCSLT